MAPSRRRDSSSIGSARAAKRPAQSPVASTPIEKPAATCGPEREFWPNTVAVVSYGIRAQYYGPVDMWKCVDGQNMRVDHPSALPQWVATNKARI